MWFSSRILLVILAMVLLNTVCSLIILYPMINLTARFESNMFYLIFIGSFLLVGSISVLVWYFFIKKEWDLLKMTRALLNRFSLQGKLET